MKKLILIFLSLVLFSASVIAEKAKIIKLIDFQNPIDFYTSWDANEGVAPGIDILIAKNENDFFIFCYSDYNWYHFYDDKYEKLFDINANPSEIGKPVYYYSDNIAIVGLMNMGESHNELHLYINNKDNIIQFSKILPQYYALKSNYLYYTDKNLLIFLTRNNVIRLYIESENEIEFFDQKATKEWLETNASCFGISKIEGRYSFGDYINDDYYKTALLNYQKLTITKKDGITYHLINDLHYESIGKDSYGLSYFRLTETSEKNIKYSLAVHNAWTNEIKIYDDYDFNDWNPPRKTNEEFIGDYPWSVSTKGDIYFFDADVTKKQYQIKKIQNRWYKDFGINLNIIGHCNNNCISLYKEKNTQNPIDVYNFDNDCLWIIEENNYWCKVRKLDGHEGWIETKYIDFDN